MEDIKDLCEEWEDMYDLLKKIKEYLVETGGDEGLIMEIIEVLNE
jgi:hypothetical protein